MNRGSGNEGSMAVNEPQATSGPPWLDWSRRLQSIAQNGLTFSRDPYDIERYTAIRQIAAEILAQGSGLSLTVIQGVLAQETDYATPKVDVRGVVFRDDQLLLVRERVDGRWTLPGGWADPGQSPVENVVREIQEESGFVVRALKILAVFDRAKHPHIPPFAFHVYKIFILCSLVSGNEAVSAETDDVGFFSEEDLPELSISRVTLGQIDRMFEHHRNPALPTDFDLED